MQFPVITYGMALYIYTNDSMPTKHWHWENLWICERARSGRARIIFAFSHSKTAISFNILLYFWYFISETYIFQAQITIIMQFPVLTYGMALYTVYRQNTNIEKIYEYVSERQASELEKNSHSKTAISFNILLVLLILYLRNIYIFRSQIQSSIQFPVLTYVWRYTQYTDNTLTLRKSMNMRASLDFFLLHILKLKF